ncbi:MAG TPA: M28 family peptidase [Gemmatimonadales bacterium]
MTVSAASALAATALAAQQSCPATTHVAMPLKYKGGPTVPAITACDLMTRLYIYADDSMRGREAGSPDAQRATAYIEGQVKALGLKPGGTKGSFYEYMPVTATYADSASTISSGGKTFHAYRDFDFNNANADVSGQAIFGGEQGDTTNELAPSAIQGKIVIELPRPGGRGGFAGGRGGRGGRGTGGQVPPNPLAGAAAVLTVDEKLVAPRVSYTLHDTVQDEGVAAYCQVHAADDARACARLAGGGRGGRGGGFGGGIFAATISPSMATALLGKEPSTAVKGDLGRQATISAHSKTVLSPTRDVIAVLPGSDPKLKNEYVLIGGHSDHIGTANSAVAEHDSLKAYNEIAQTQGAERTGRITPDAEQWARINAIKDSLRKIYPPRMDSISNGADDDGTGSVSVLEIAQAFAKGSVKPKRSIIFIWQMGEEKGLWGSQYFTNYPTLPRDSIVGDLNIDMVGRGEATDVTGISKDGAVLHGSPDYVQLVGARRLSTEFGDIAESANKTEKAPLQFDYSMDANGHPQNIYCRSDHANYARYDIPVIFFTTGGHADYHQVTDEPQYIRYEHMARVDQLIFDIAVKVADLDHRLVVDGKKPVSPFASCQQ